MTTLQTTWFVLVAVLLGGYAILDGFDLGVGLWYLIDPREEDRRSMLAAISPMWDGNEVWLITGGGALFASFPAAYASAFSAMYLALILVLAGLIFRAVAIEFRNKHDSRAWRASWDLAFGLGSTLPALLFGVAVGNLLRGLPLDRQGDFTGTFQGLLNPHALTIGATSLAMMATHGAVWLSLKCPGDLESRARSWAMRSWVAWAALFAISTAWSLVAHPDLADNFRRAPALWALPAIAVAGLAGIPLMLSAHAPGKAFVASAVTIAAMVAIAGASLYPRLIPAAGDPSLSITILSSSSRLSLTVMLVIALVGMPVVIAYTAWVYWTFRGKAAGHPEGH